MELSCGRHELRVRSDRQEHRHRGIYYTQTQVFKGFIKRQHVIIQYLEVIVFRISLSETRQEIRVECLVNLRSMMNDPDFGFMHPVNMMSTRYFFSSK